MAISLASAPQAVVARLCSGAETSRFPWTRRVCTRGWSAPLYRSVGRLECKAHKVEIEHEGEKHVLDVPEGESILTVALEAGLSVSYDCNLGVCMTCPAKLEKGTVDQDQGMLSDDVKERGYTLMCVAYPQSDCFIRTIPEEELLSLQLATADD